MLLALVLGCAEPQAAPPSAGTPVMTALVTRGRAEVRLTLVGEVQSPSQALLAAEVAGTVQSVPARVGTLVKRGDLLVGLDPRSFEIARRTAVARVEQAAATVAVRRADLERVKVTTARLLSVRQSDPAAVSALEAEDATLREDSANATLLAALADLHVREAELDAALLDLARARIVAPFDGAVALQEARIGQRVSAGAHLVSVMGGGALEAVLDLGEGQVGQVVPGVQVRIETTRGDVSAEGTVAGVVPAADGTSRNQRVRVDLPDPPAGMLPGLAVRGVVEVATVEGATQVPRDAVARGAVFVVESGKVRRVPVVAVHDLGETLVVEGALEAGQEVVTRGTEALSDGASVSVVGAARVP